MRLKEYTDQQQSCCMQMGVRHIYLDAASELAHRAWVAESLKFCPVGEERSEELRGKHTLVHHADVHSRLLKEVSSRPDLLKQVWSALGFANHAAHVALSLDHLYP